MKHIAYYILAAAVLAIASCENTDYTLYDTAQKDRLYFEADSLGFIFGLTADEDIDFHVPVKLIGFVDKAGDRTFTYRVNTELSTAVEGTHFNLPRTTVIERDSTHSIVALDFVKPALEKGRQYVLTLDLVEDSNFLPTDTRQCSIYFGDVSIPAPVWWMAEYVGVYNQEKLIMFVELFHAAEELSPVIFKAIVGYWGRNLDVRGYSREAYLLTTASYRPFHKKYILEPIYEHYLTTGDETYKIPKPV